MKIGAFLFAALGLASCQQDFGIKPLPSGHDLKLNLPNTPLNYNLPVNNEIPTLGRVLFYDPRLSKDNTTSCSSCHKQNNGFADNTPISKGVSTYGSATLKRNTLAIQNIRFGGLNDLHPVLFWDGRSRDLQQMVLQPIQNNAEMGMNIDLLITKLSSYPEYRILFSNAYDSDLPTKEGIAEALSWFISSIRTNHSRYDKYLAGNTNILSNQEKLGMNIFQSRYGCNSCHRVNESTGQQGLGTFNYMAASGGRFANTGIDEHNSDPGLANVTLNPADAGKFRIPSLRNIEHTAPYMHDGRFRTLEDVINYYDHGISNNVNLDDLLRNPNGGVAVRLYISPNDRDAIIAFLKTLTDDTPATDVKLSNPFR